MTERVQSRIFYVQTLVKREGRAMQKAAVRTQASKIKNTSGASGACGTFIGNEHQTSTIINHHQPTTNHQPPTFYVDTTNAHAHK